MSNWYIGPDRVWVELPAGMCPRCQEERIVTRVVDARGERYYCGVCAHEWKGPDRKAGT